MANLSAMTIIQFLLALACNIGAVGLLPKTQGFTNLGYSALSLLCIGITTFLMARLIHSGAQLSFLMPVFTVTIPLASIALGVLVYKESASLVNVGLLVLACILVFSTAYIKSPS